MMREGETPSHFAADSAELHCDAYNAAFYELGLRWHWDLPVYRDLFPQSEAKERLSGYLQNRHPHLLKAYDADFLSQAIQTAKARCYEALVARGVRSPSQTDWAAVHRAEIGV